MLKPPYIQEHQNFNGTQIIVSPAQAPDQIAQFAMHLMDHFGVVAATDTDQCDPAGRAKLRLQTPEEVVTRACAIAELAYAEFEKRGWMLELPAPTPRKLKADEL